MALVPSAALAQAATDTTGYLKRVFAGAPPECLACPPRICPGEPLPVTLVGVLPSGCVKFRGVHVLPTQSPLPVVAVDFDVDTCGVVCTPEPQPFQYTFMLGAYPPGGSQLVIMQRVRSCEDTTQVAYVNRRIVSFEVPDVCPTPVPLDTLVRGFTKLSVSPPAPCVGDAVRMSITENGCPPCVSIRSFEFVPARDGWVATLDWAPTCAEFNCDIDTLSVPVPGSGAAGAYALRVLTDVVVHGAGDPRVLTFERTLSYAVRPTCEPPVGCLDPRLPPSMPPLPECGLLLGPGERGEVVLPVQSSVAAEGAEGVLFVGGAFRVVGVRYAGAAPGAFVSWQPEGRGARFLVFGGSPTIPIGDSPLLRVVIEGDSSTTLEATGSLNGVITLASDAQGQAVQLCRTPAEPIAPAPRIVLCRRSPQAECDVNGDGRSDVRDLVRMVGCLRRMEGDSTRTGDCHDCDGNGQFQLDDVFCCAQRILRGSGLPGDSAHVRDGLSVTMDPAEDAGSVQRVRIHVRGAAALGAALLRVSYPADRWRAVAPPLTADPIVPSGWLPIDDLGEPGLARVGLLRLEPTASDDVSYTLLLEPLDGAPAGGEVRVQGADLSLPDGGLVAPVTPFPGTPLAGAPAVLEVALSAARPNPFNTSTSFVVSLPRAATAELAIIDLAGRRVATLSQGPLGAGSHTFFWDGAGARDGVYFARLSVGGRVHTSRVALLKHGH